MAWAGRPRDPGGMSAGVGVVCIVRVGGRDNRPGERPWHPPVLAAV